MADFFVERSQAQTLVKRLLEPSATAPELEPVVSEVGGILDRYQEQSHLLDPHLDSLVTPLMARARATLRGWPACTMARTEGASMPMPKATVAHMTRREPLSQRE